MATSIIQPSFAAGELSPNLFARVDLAKFHVGAARCYNAFVDYRGGLSSRPGTRFVAKAGKATGNIRLIKFQFSILQTYVLEFGDHYMRVVKNGGLVLNGDGTPYTLVTPWAAADLPLLKFAQSNDVMTFTHASYPIYDLARLAENNWQLSVVNFGITIQPPGGLQATVAPASTSISTLYTYVITSVDASGNESLASYVTGIGCNNFSERVQSITISWEPVGGAAYYNVYKATPQALVVGGTTDYVSAAQYGFITSSQGVQAVDTNILPNTAKTPPVHRNPFAVGAITSFSVPAGGQNYRNVDGVTVSDPTGFGFVGNLILINGSLRGIQIVNGGQNYTAPVVNIGGGSGGTGATVYANVGPPDGLSPGVVTYFQQRKTFAASARFPATYWMTQPGAFTNMDISLPVNDGNALTFTLAALEQNPIKYMIPVQNGLIMLTGGAAWLVSGGDNNSAITPNSVKQTPQVYNGCADVLPLVVGTNLLYVQEKGYVVQDLKYEFFSNTYTGDDRTYYSSHLFEGRMIIDWAWSEQPQKLVWAVMNDGKLLSMTYIKEQEVFGWAQHETNGAAKAVACIPEGDEDVVYFVVDRAFGRCIERLSTRRFTSMADAWALDCALRYVGPPVTRVSGLPMLAGDTVAAVVDGAVYPGLIVGDGGLLPLPVAGSNVLVGYSFATEFDSLYLDTGDPTIQGKRKKIAALTLRLVKSKGLLAGNSPSTVVPVKEDGGVLDLFSKDERLVLDNRWSEEGQIFIRGSEGCPWTLTAIIPEVMGGDTRG